MGALFFYIMERKDIYEIKIMNGAITSTFSFANEEKMKPMLEAVNNCLKDEKKYESIIYKDSKGGVCIFPAKYLKNSLITITVNE